jgi:hypothetical protein
MARGPSRPFALEGVEAMVLDVCAYKPESAYPVVTRYSALFADHDLVHITGSVIVVNASTRVTT